MKNPELNTSQNSAEFEGDPAQYTEAELMEDPAKRFHVNKKDFSVLPQQYEYNVYDNSDNEKHYLPIDKIMTEYATFTADAVAFLAGESEKGEREKPFDNVIYLDKSARPVGWFINTFWDAFTDKKRPATSHLAIDRIDWFNRTGTPVNSKGEIIEYGQAIRRATFSDFKKENVTPEMLARIRAVFIPGGIESDEMTPENIEKIMHTPTILDGKDIAIVDEVEHTGSTLEIAKYLVSEATDVKSIETFSFWHAGSRIDKNGQSQIVSAPVWYNANDTRGRGIGDINESYWDERYDKTPTPLMRARKLGSFVLGTHFNLEKESGRLSKGLMGDIKKMREEWDEGHILLGYTRHYQFDKLVDHLKEQGIHVAPVDSEKTPAGRKTNYVHILRKIQGEE